MNGLIRVTASGGKTIDSTSGFGVDASLGGQVFFELLPPVTGGAGDLTIDGATAVPSATLAALGQSIMSLDGSLASRV